MRKIKGLLAIFAVTMALAAVSAAQTSFVSIDGAKVDLAAQKGKVVILAVGASWLPLSAKQAEYTNILAKRYAGKNVVVYYVATDSVEPKSKNFATNDDIAKFVAANKLIVPVLRDSNGTVILKSYDIDQLPSFVILDRSGARSGEPFGGIDPKFDVTIPISRAVDKLL